ncbi:hypothetical protein [Fodinibius sp.]|uniref:hypothetical protein n=1 Tax=Fodinibius sp. TaxID=1872440 RepID=UPI002ACE3F0A|nr:hypothetical protein [Fodinibius sp.]MDZ7659655.1 hypothetical protein [Fodinibius sp.]
MTTAKEFRSYYQTDRYKGFYQIKKSTYPLSRMTLLAFSNGKKNIYATGVYAEEAMAKIFSAIDQYHLKKKAKRLAMV